MSPMQHNISLFVHSAKWCQPTSQIIKISLQIHHQCILCHPSNNITKISLFVYVDYFQLMQTGLSTSSISTFCWKKCCAASYSTTDIFHMIHTSRYSCKNKIHEICRSIQTPSCLLAIGSHHRLYQCIWPPTRLHQWI